MNININAIRFKPVASIPRGIAIHDSRYRELVYKFLESGLETAELELPELDVEQKRNVAASLRQVAKTIRSHSGKEVYVSIGLGNVHLTVNRPEGFRALE